jgi:hypothetical protein
MPFAVCVSSLVNECMCFMKYASQCLSQVRNNLLMLRKSNLRLDDGNAIAAVRAVSIK